MDMTHPAHITAFLGYLRETVNGTTCRIAGFIRAHAGGQILFQSGARGGTSARRPTPVQRAAVATAISPAVAAYPSSASLVPQSDHRVYAAKHARPGPLWLDKF